MKEENPSNSEDQRISRCIHCGLASSAVVKTILCLNQPPPTFMTVFSAQRGKVDLHISQVSELSFPSRVFT